MSIDDIGRKVRLNVATEVKNARTGRSRRRRHAGQGVRPHPIEPARRHRPSAHRGRMGRTIRTGPVAGTMENQEPGRTDSGPVRGKQTLTPRMPENPPRQVFKGVLVFAERSNHDLDHNQDKSEKAKKHERPAKPSYDANQEIYHGLKLLTTLQM